MEVFSESDGDFFFISWKKLNKKEYIKKDLYFQ